MTKETADTIVAVATVAAALVAGFSAFIAARSARDAAKSLVVTVEAIRAQTFWNVAAYERSLNLSERMRTVKAVTTSAVREEDLADILAVADFFNLVAHLIRNHYIAPAQMMLLYSPRLDECRMHLIKTGWLAEYRADVKEGRMYLHFENLCREDNMKKFLNNRVEDGMFTKDPFKPGLEGI